jgi:hypothetical protein
MPDLAQAQAGDCGYLLKREAREIVHVDDLHGLGTRLSHLFHQQSDFDDLAGAGGIGLFIGGALIEKNEGREGAAFEREARPRKIHQHAAHGASGDGIEMLTAPDVPAAFVHVAEPDFVDELSGRDRSEIALLAKMAHG